MSKVQQVLKIAREELAKTEGETVSKDELLGTLDNLIKSVPQAAAMDEQQLDIFVTYMNAINAKVDLMFNALTLTTLATSKNARVNVTLDRTAKQMTALQAKLDRDLMQIVDPEAAAAQDKKDAEVQAAAAGAMLKKKK